MMATQTKKVRILVVDDHAMLRQALTTSLNQEQELEVVGSVSNAADGIEQARALDPDVVLMDVKMPGMSGIEATRKLLAERPGMRIIGFSMHNESVVVREMLAAGAMGYINKGTSIERMIEEILEVANREH